MTSWIWFNLVEFFVTIRVNYQFPRQVIKDMTHMHFFSWLRYIYMCVFGEIFGFHLGNRLLEWHVRKCKQMADSRVIAVVSREIAVKCTFIGSWLHTLTHSYTFNWKHPIVCVWVGVCVGEWLCVYNFFPHTWKSTSGTPTTVLPLPCHSFNRHQSAVSQLLQRRLPLSKWMWWRLQQLRRDGGES